MDLKEVIREAELLDRHIGALAGTHPAPRPKPVRELPEKVRGLLYRLRVAAEEVAQAWETEHAARMQAERRCAAAEARLAEALARLASLESGAGAK
jgi:hypothetical protein